MKMFIWESVSGLTCNYHDGGGLVVVASSLARARELAPGKSDALTVEPDKTYTLADSEEERTFVFPDSGCC